MTSPKDRDALVEYLARAMWEDPAENEDPSEATWEWLLSRSNGRSVANEYRNRATASLAALESAGLAVVPVETLREILGQEPIPAGFWCPRWYPKPGLDLKHPRQG